jgi:hypothetical protein
VPPATGNPKVRLTGAVLLVLAVLAYVGAATGWDAHGTAGRIVLVVVGTLLLLLGLLLLLRTRTPSVSSVRADPAGLHITVAGNRSTVVKWSAIEAIRVHRISKILGGHTLSFRLVDESATVALLRPFEAYAAGGGRQVLIGMTAAQSSDMIRDLPRFAGPRFGIEQ